jgi:GT2 family glycosyltransferase
LFFIMDDTPPALTVILVSYNTRALTLTALKTLHDTTRKTDFEVILWDNASADGSADAVAAAFPDVRLVRSPDNLGFARANNEAAKLAHGTWLLLLNTDTEVYEGAIDALMDFAKAHPEHGIYGGRTVFPDGSLNIASCWNRMTPWSLFSRAVGLSKLFRRSVFFNPEGIGDWRRDTVREVDIVVGCLLLIRRELWETLGGFDPTFWMYGEEADLCLRARAAGYRPVITPDATIMHLVGASSRRADKAILVNQARATLIDRHWPRLWQPWGKAMLWLEAGLRHASSRLFARLSGRDGDTEYDAHARIWAARAQWLAGYPTPADPRTP